MSSIWLPQIIDDHICDDCDDDAMPYEWQTGCSLCPEHQMELWSGIGFEDYLIDAEDERLWEESSASANEMSDPQRCSYICCKEPAEMRLDPYTCTWRDKIWLCTKHATELLLPVILQKELPARLDDQVLWTGSDD